MKTIHGTAASATIFHTESNNSIDDYAIAQIRLLCNHPAFSGCRIRIMPDVHPGKVGTIGFTSTLDKQILPNVIGVDIGCGITLAKFKGKGTDFQKLDTVIRENIPSGSALRTKPHRLAADFDFTALHCYDHIQKDRALHSLGTLGSGNHFFEVDEDDAKDKYLVIHSGSRHLGVEVTEHYLREGQKVLKAAGMDVPYELTTLSAPLMQHYLHDLAIVQEFASLNRHIILSEICKCMKWKIRETHTCIHNYIDFDAPEPILRKGAISAKKGEYVMIPINMRDGILIGTGLGNAEWNTSAPHGAGRILKREDVRSHFTISQFKREMKGIYSTCIHADTLDEAPFAYRGIEVTAQ